MPSVSEKQRKMIFAKRSQYGSKDKTPEKWKWIWGKEWTKIKKEDYTEKYVPFFEEGSLYRADIFCEAIINPKNYCKSIEKKIYSDKFKAILYKHISNSDQLCKAQGGEDSGEIIISNAKVLCIFKKIKSNGQTILKVIKK